MSSQDTNDSSPPTESGTSTRRVEAKPPLSAMDGDWLRDFYKECGREITLAYTTLNQMQNWVIIIQAAIAAAVGTFIRANPPGSSETSLTAMVVGASIAHLFTLRFFVRAVICYTNLLRWNRLQKAILEGGGKPAVVNETIRVYYHEWHAPISRVEQVVSNLKLGFSLLFLLPVTAIIFGIAVLPSSALLRASVTAAVLGTMLEAYHFLRDGWFDDPAAAARRAKPRPGFPGPGGSLDHVWGWLLILGGSAAAGALPRILESFACRP